MLIGIPPAHPPFQKNECFLIIMMIFSPSLNSCWAFYITLSQPPPPPNVGTPATSRSLLRLLRGPYNQWTTTTLARVSALLQRLTFGTALSSKRQSSQYSAIRHSYINYWPLVLISQNNSYVRPVVWYASVSGDIAIPH